ncbi:collagen-binding domain-containing protein [Lactiplantibacillus paraxiangfangensis]|uniref:collagen-binding domain-containing protein n=1 Tax=Lactiplantibacillus paraxiangfangensis TaxID=3076224 RepID=UPI0030C76BE5
MQRQIDQTYWTAARHVFRILVATFAFASGISLMPATVLATDSSEQPATEQVQPSTERPTIPSGGTVYEDHPNLQNVLGVASQFHIFARSAELETHTAGNLAVQKLTGHVDFGTTNKLELLDRDITYLQTIDKIAKSSFISAGPIRCNKVIFGENITIDTSNPQGPLINGVIIDHLVTDEVYQDQPGQVYLDFDAEFATLSQLNLTLSQTSPQAQFSNANFTDENNRVIDVSKLGSVNGQIVINLVPEVLSLSRPLIIKGLSDTPNGPTVIFNVDTGAADYVVNSPIKISYQDGTERNNKDADDFGDNHLLWNFHNGQQAVTGTLTVNATSQGSVLLPHGNLVANQNMDGNLIANNVLIQAESHRWDLQDNSGDEQEPEEEDEEEEETITEPDPEEEDEETITEPDPEDKDKETVTEPEPEKEDKETVTEPDPEKEDLVTPETPAPEKETTKEPNESTAEKEKVVTKTESKTADKSLDAPAKRSQNTTTIKASDQPATLTPVSDDPAVEQLDTALTQALAQPTNRNSASPALKTLDRHIQQAQAANDPVRATQLATVRSRGLAAANLQRLPQTDERDSIVLTIIGLCLTLIALGIGWYRHRRTHAN